MMSEESILFSLKNLPCIKQNSNNKFVANSKILRIINFRGEPEICPFINCQMNQTPFLLIQNRRTLEIVSQANVERVKMCSIDKIMQNLEHTNVP